MAEPDDGNRGRHRNPRPVPRITLTKSEAAEAFGISIDSFERHVQPDVRVIRRGRMRLFRVRELERWADEEAAFTFDPREATR